MAASLRNYLITHHTDESSEAINIMSTSFLSLISICGNYRLNPHTELLFLRCIPKGNLELNA